ncbi:putative F-box/FBD/LRR-repeat protein At1g16940 [Arabidopsis lyrata subsp. lyrata]|uniref:putative F-box/FBD/LRR-repeat protein At1g16940 n=1 Tax=Arabidopsis lyrata subsp. lyrata TaxID=81972 RepID=UPI000A29C9D4|nr:putative F-box/FBD/LRR-repeat protein At1g16940 [Arabidopsis lyrata subsp. lyrata]|eukprot:XP_020867452.1 putative F-box/FBD/LRR-repeat protein At1g16940 [Arabidopsis lyrata subsp. lyrata]
MINQLPDSLIYEILFNLPTEDVVKTSLLCRRWRYVWQSVPGLDLVINGFIKKYDPKFDFLDRFIDLNYYLCLQRVKLRYVGYGQNYRIKTSMDTVIKQKIQHLDVGSNSRYAYDRLEIPPTIYTSCERLVSLKLYRANLPKSPDSVSLPCLKIMDLQQINFVDSLEMEKLVSVCPALETLTTDKMYGVKVSSQSLLSFCLTKNGDGYLKTQVVMQTPKLKYLKLNRHFIERIILNDLSSIVMLNLDDLMYFGETLLSILKLISCVRDLTISFDILQDICQFSKSKSLPKFHNLSILSVTNMMTGSWESLLIFLESCPDLKSLVLGFQDHNWGVNFSDVPQCVLSSLEFVEVKARDVADMNKLGSYFMENSTVLEKFTLCLDYISECDHVTLGKLFTLPRRSNKCEVVVSSRKFGTYKPLSLFSGADGFCC